MFKNIFYIILPIYCLNIYSDYLNNFRMPREFPNKYMERTLHLFKSKEGKVIVEIGSMRFPLNHNVYGETCPYCMDGHSTYFWVSSNAKVYTIDINPENTKLTLQYCNKFNIQAITQDGIEFLKSFTEPIDLLFLDAWDAVEGTDFAEKHLEAYLVAKKNLHDNSLILIDDTDILEGGKGKLVIPEALKDGFKVIFNGRQTLLSK